MAPARSPTVMLLEAAWAEGLAPEGSFFSAQTSLRPFLDTLNTWVPTRVLHREFRSLGDLRCWCTALQQARLGPNKIVFLAAHGVWSVGRRHKMVDLWAPDDVRTAMGNRLSPADVRRCLARCGPTGVMVLACGWGKNEPASWLPPNVTWALAFEHSVLWFEAAIYCTRAITWLCCEGHPRNGPTAHSRYRSGARTGRLGYDACRYDHRAIATALGARFYWRERGEWKVCQAPEFA